MSMQAIRWQLLVGIVLIMLLATGCFQAVDEDVQGIAVAESRPSDTPTFTPSPTDEETPQVVAQAASETPTPSPTTALDQPIGDVVPAGTAIAQDLTAQAQDDTWSLTATAIIAEITQTHASSLTQTATAQGLGPTATPTPTGTVPVVDPQPTVSPSGDSCQHQVQPGENLFRLSLRYGLPVSTIAADSNITNIQLIRVGQILNIRGCGTTGVTPPPIVTTPVPPVDPPGPGTSTCPGVYTVQQYDTLFSISMRCGVPVQSIANANGITNVNFILMGRELVIPSS